VTETLLGERVVTSSRTEPKGRTRGRRQSSLLRIGGTIDTRWRVGLSVAGVAVVLVAWTLAAAQANDAALFPTPMAAARALQGLWSDGSLRADLWASSFRIALGYGLSVGFGIVFGILIGTFPAIEAFFEAQIGFLRYIPAAALLPVFLLWLGIGESPKVWLIVVGTVFFNILMIADAARAVPRELINAAYTLGAGRWTVLRRVIARYSVPGIVDAARVNLAAAWLMLVVSEILAADHGLAISIVKLQRFRAVDGMFALLFTFGVIGLVSDLFLRFLRNRLAPWARS
jgi:NitT/TauT family transport system permease protein